ncbi:unnamed protein product [Cylindrotheca closterium]|uniref:Uncharacterized protein n=1 Tax=Cylindrotheca closterium TaxID=2856 RepID=A0AAD2CEX7_9STRA|nr:unnamed protein product [Cylindrotheca closterium]
MSDAETEQLSEYEQLRNERIKRNEAKLEKLGLITLVADILQKQKKGKTKKKPRTKKRMVKAGQERRSARLKRKADGVDDAEDQDHVMLSYDSDDFIEDESKPAPRSRRLKLDDFIVNPKELKALEKHIDKNYLGKFREFLKCVDNISDPNEKNVMRQITKLANGEGVRYTSPQFGWPEGCYFMKGEPVTPISDVVELLNEAQKCEDEWGRDHGNGWLLRHPLKKLLMFQQFCLRQPAFLKSKCKLPQYCEEVERRAEKDTGNKKSGNRRVSQSKSAVSKLKKRSRSNRPRSGCRRSKRFKGT